MEGYPHILVQILVWICILRMELGNNQNKCFDMLGFHGITYNLVCYCQFDLKFLHSSAPLLCNCRDLKRLLDQHSWVQLYIGVDRRVWLYPVGMSAFGLGSFYILFLIRNLIVHLISVMTFRMKVYGCLNFGAYSWILVNFSVLWVVINCFKGLLIITIY